jgi:hypothetical protein
VFLDKIQGHAHDNNGADDQEAGHIAGERRDSAGNEEDDDQGVFEPCEKLKDQRSLCGGRRIFGPTYLADQPLRCSRDPQDSSIVSGVRNGLLPETISAFGGNRHEAFLSNIKGACTRSRKRDAKKRYPQITQVSQIKPI